MTVERAAVEHGGEGALAESPAPNSFGPNSSGEARRSPTDLTTGGHVRPIIRWGAPLLHARSRPVTEFGVELHALVRDMFATMRAAEGVGLAAPQVGVDLAMFVLDCPDDEHVRHVGVFCNPVVSMPEGEDRRLDLTDEGCLSLPGAYLELARPDRAVCSGQDAFGEAVTLSGHGLLARCLQHETDHLNGTVFGDRLSARGRKKLYALHRDVAEHYPDDWPVSPKT